MDDDGSLDGLVCEAHERLREQRERLGLPAAQGPAESAAFSAGVLWARTILSERARKAAAEERLGSDLRGRKIVLHRPLWPDELEREGMNKADSWPCLELDTGTLVYCLPHGQGHGTTAPGQLVGWSAERREKVGFCLQVADLGARQQGPAPAAGAAP